MADTCWTAAGGKIPAEEVETTAEEEEGAGITADDDATDENFLTTLSDSVT